jgi:galactokinase
MSVGLALLLFDTGQEHATSGAAYAERVNECRDAAAALSVTSLREVSDVGSLAPIANDVVRRRARHVVSENERVLAVAQLLGLGRASDIGPVLYDSHSSLRDDYEVSTPELDLIVEEAMQAGALGARMTGAGFGGSALVLLDRKDITQVTKQVLAAFERAWGRTPTVREVSPSGGASPQPL